MQQEYAPGKSPSIRGLMPGLPEVGKIKIGRKGDQRKSSDGGTYNLPTKVDHFILTTLQREPDGVNFSRDAALYSALKLEDKPKRLPIRLLFDDINLNLQSRYACYTGKTLFCSGDGVGAFQLKPGAQVREQVPCPCHRSGQDYKGPDKCKIHTKLSCLVDGAGIIGGVWVLRTTSYNTTVGLYGSLMLIRTMTGGVLAGLPLVLVVRPKVATDPAGKSVTIYVVGIEFNGDMSALQAQSLQLAQKNAEYRQRLIAVEDEVRKMISVDAELVDESGDIVEEFHPEESGPPAAIAPAPAPAPTEPAAKTEPAAGPAIKRGRPRKATSAAPAAQAESSVSATPEPDAEPEAPQAVDAPAPAEESTPAAPAIVQGGLDLFQ